MYDKNVSHSLFDNKDRTSITALHDHHATSAPSSVVSTAEKDSPYYKKPEEVLLQGQHSPSSALVPPAAGVQSSAPGDHFAMDPVKTTTSSYNKHQKVSPYEETYEDQPSPFKKLSPRAEKESTIKSSISPTYSAHVPYKEDHMLNFNKRSPASYEEHYEGSESSSAKYHAKTVPYHDQYSEAYDEPTTIKSANQYTKVPSSTIYEEDDLLMDKEPPPLPSSTIPTTTSSSTKFRKSAAFEQEEYEKEPAGFKKLQPSPVVTTSAPYEDRFVDSGSGSFQKTTALYEEHFDKPSIYDQYDKEPPSAYVEEPATTRTVTTLYDDDYEKQAANFKKCFEKEISLDQQRREEEPVLPYSKASDEYNEAYIIDDVEPTPTYKKQVSYDPEVVAYDNDHIYDDDALSFEKKLADYEKEALYEMAIPVTSAAYEKEFPGVAAYDGNDFEEHMTDISSVACTEGYDDFSSGYDVWAEKERERDKTAAAALIMQAERRPSQEKAEMVSIDDSSFEQDDSYESSGIPTDYPIISDGTMVIPTTGKDYIYGDDRLRSRTISETSDVYDSLDQKFVPDSGRTDPCDIVTRTTMAQQPSPLPDELISTAQQQHKQGLELNDVRVTTTTATSTMMSRAPVPPPAMTTSAAATEQQRRGPLTYPTVQQNSRPVHPPPLQTQMSQPAPSSTAEASAASSAGGFFGSLTSKVSKGYQSMVNMSSFLTKSQDDTSASPTPIGGNLQRSSVAASPSKKKATSSLLNLGGSLDSLKLGSRLGFRSDSVQSETGLANVAMTSTSCEVVTTVATSTTSASYANGGVPVSKAHSEKHLPAASDYGAEVAAYNEMHQSAQTLQRDDQLRQSLRHGSNTSQVDTEYSDESRYRTPVSGASSNSDNSFVRSRDGLVQADESNNSLWAAGPDDDEPSMAYGHEDTSYYSTASSRSQPNYPANYPRTTTTTTAATTTTTTTEGGADSFEDGYGQSLDSEQGYPAEYEPSGYNDYDLPEQPEDLYTPGYEAGADQNELMGYEIPPETHFQEDFYTKRRPSLTASAEEGPTMHDLSSDITSETNGRFQDLGTADVPYNSEDVVGGMCPPRGDGAPQLPSGKKKWMMAISKEASVDQSDPGNREAEGGGKKSKWMALSVRSTFNRN